MCNHVVMSLVHIYHLSLLCSDNTYMHRTEVTQTDISIIIFVVENFHLLCFEQLLLETERELTGLCLLLRMLLRLGLREGRREKEREGGEVERDDEGKGDRRAR